MVLYVGQPLELLSYLTSVVLVHQVVSARSFRASASSAALLLAAASSAGSCRLVRRRLRRLRRWRALSPPRRDRGGTCRLSSSLCRFDSEHKAGSGATSSRYHDSIICR